MMQRFSFIILVTMILFQSLAAKQRVLILTDISNEPDDAMSMVRLLLYSNEVHLEGLVATTGCWLKSNPRADEIAKIVDAYGQVYENLLLHKPDYPTADFLHSLIKTGNSGYSMGDVGEGHNSEGSDYIISLVDQDDPRPIWICVWGGANTLAQALWDVKNTRTPEQVENFVSKIRVYDLAGQDDSGAWMTHTFPRLFYIRSLVQWQGISNRVDGAWPESRGGDESVWSTEWVNENIQNNHGPLGTVYPDAAFLHEGDTPTYLYVLPTGLSDPNQPTWGNWGGRFLAEPQINPRSSQSPVLLESDYDNYWMITEAEEHWQWKDEVYENVYSAIFRWRVDFQNDFAARMDWCVQPFENANHNPCIVLDDDSTKNVLFQHVNPADRITFDASQTYDIDGDSVFYDWWIYQEPGSYENPVSLSQNDSCAFTFDVPHDAAGTSMHLILTAHDNGEPNLYSYRRIVIYVEPYEEFVDRTPPIFVAYVDSHYIDYRTKVPVSLQTDERAFLRFDYEDKPFAEMLYDFFQGQGGVRHTTVIEAEQGEQVSLYVRAQDMAGNESADAVHITFTVDTLQTPICWNENRYLAKWPKGKTPIGLGFDDIQTNTENVNTIYLRKTLNLEDVQEIENVRVRIEFADGCVLYVNGQEIRRNYMPNDEINYFTPARYSSKDINSIRITIRGDDLACLRPGENLFAVEVHQDADAAGDLSFDAEIEVDGEKLLPYGSEWYFSDLGEVPYVQTLGGILSGVGSALPVSTFHLAQNYPNPFNPSTTIQYELAYNCDVRIYIYNALGQRINTLINSKKTAGQHFVQWNGMNNAGDKVSSGIYFYQLLAGEFSETRKMIYMQ